MKYPPGGGGQVSSPLHEDERDLESVASASTFETPKCNRSGQRPMVTNADPKARYKVQPTDFLTFLIPQYGKAR